MMTMNALAFCILANFSIIAMRQCHDNCCKSLPYLLINRRNVTSTSIATVGPASIADANAESTVEGAQRRLSTRPLPQRAIATLNTAPRTTISLHRDHLSICMATISPGTIPRRVENTAQCGERGMSGM
jgi:hypothetical protein